MNRYERNRPEAVSPPWWRVRMMWLVLGGPLAVVVAGVITTAIAIRGADPVLSTRPVPEAAQGSSDPALRPAIEGRNHAALPAGVR